MDNSNTETTITVDPNFAIQAVLDDKLEYNSVKLLSNSQNKLISTQKDNNEEQR
jgi:hypothetical protein